MRKSQMAEILGRKLKEIGFGKVMITGVDYKGDYYKGIVKDETVEIQVVPNMIMEEGKTPVNFKGNIEFLKRQRERNRMPLNKEM